jgi:hypothetical protein
MAGAAAHITTRAVGIRALCPRRASASINGESLSLRPAVTVSNACTWGNQNLPERLSGRTYGSRLRRLVSRSEPESGKVTVRRRLEDLPTDTPLQGHGGRHRGAAAGWTNASPLKGPITAGRLEHLQRTAGNEAATWLMVQRHEIEEPAEELETLETVVQRAPLTQDQMDEAEARVDTAIRAAVGVSKARNPILYNTGKAFTKGDVTKAVRDTDPRHDKAWVAGAAPKLVNLGGQWVLASSTIDIQGALAHEVAHILAGPGLDEYQDEFNAYWAEYTVRDRRAPNPARLGTIQGLLARYGWWATASAAKRQQWGTVGAPRGFNLSNSWKQAKLRDLMENSRPAATVATHIRSMNRIDRVEARDALRALGQHYLQWANYPPADRTTIWRALGGAGAAPAT